MRLLVIVAAGCLVCAPAQANPSQEGELHQLEVELALAFTHAVSGASEEAAVLMAFSQMHWRQYREQECIVAALVSPNPRRARFDCWFHVTAARLRVVRSWTEPRARWSLATP